MIIAIITGSKGRMAFRSCFPVFPQQVAAVSQAGAPDKRAGKGIDQEFTDIHPGDAGRQADIGTYYRQQTGDKDRPAAAAGEPAVGDIQVVLGNQDVASVFVQAAAGRPTYRRNKR